MIGPELRWSAWPRQLSCHGHAGHRRRLRPFFVDIHECFVDDRPNEQFAAGTQAAEVRLAGENASFMPMSLSTLLSWNSEVV